MPNHVVIFPEGKLTEANAYRVWTNDAARNPFHPDDFNYPEPKLDAFGQHVLAFLGPPFTWDAVVIPEPEGGPAMRADGVLHSSYVWPPEEEE